MSPVQDGSHSITKQALVQIARSSIVVERNCLHRKMAHAAPKARLSRTFTEAPHQRSQPQAQIVSALAILRQRVLSGPDRGQGRRTTVHASFAFQFELPYDLVACAEYCHWRSKSLGQRTNRQHVRAAEIEARKHSASASAIRRIRNWRTAKDSQRLRVVNHHPSAASANGFEVRGERSGLSADRTKSICQHYRPQPAATVARQFPAQRLCIVMRELPQRNTPPRGPFRSPAGDWVSPRVQVNGHALAREHAK